MNDDPTQKPADPPPIPEEESLPPALQAELRSLHQPPIPFPPTRHAQVLAAVRHARHASSRRPWPLRFAIAASITFAAATLWMLESHTATPAYARTGDIRDAFYLQRQLNAHRSPDAAWDENHDGTVDQSDVQALALAAVRLDRPPGVHR